MKKYPADNWRRFGRLVYQARIRAGFSDTQQWAERVGRSSRMLLGLERGEPVGSGTLDLIAVALDWAPDAPYAGLENPDDFGATSTVPRDSVGAGDEAEFEFLTRVREDLTDEEMDTLMEELNPYLERLVRDIKRRRD